MTDTDPDNRLSKIETAIGTLIESQKAQLEIGQNIQTQIQLQQAQLVQQQARTDQRLREMGEETDRRLRVLTENITSVGAQVEQLYQIVMRREQGENGGE